MAVQPFAFGVRLRDGDRTVRVRIHSRDPFRYVVEDSRSLGTTRKREHKSLASALRDAAATWRGRLH